MKQLKYNYFLSLLTVLSIAGCQHLEEDVKNIKTWTLTAYLESESDTKTYLSEPDSKGIYYPYWSANDALGVYVDDIGTPDIYTLQDGTGTGKGTFAGVLHGKHMVGLYPSSAIGKDGLKDGILTLELPSVQNYVLGSFGNGAFPMLAVSDNETFSFKNLCSVIRVSLTGTDAVQSITFVANDSWMSVSGKATVDINFGEYPELIMADEGVNEVTLQCDYVPLDQSTPTDFFLVIPPGTYVGGFTIKIKTFTGVVTRGTNADITFKRSQVRSIPAFECAGNGEVNPDDLPFNEIRYVSSNNREVYLRESAFDQRVVSHTFEKGEGVIRFEGPVAVVGRDAFYGQSISEIHLPNSVTSIGNFALAHTGIESFRTPDNLKSVDSYAFDRTDALKRIYGKWASSDEKAIVLEDGSMVVYAKMAVTSDLVIPEGVKSLAKNLFSNYDLIQSVVLPKGLTAIGDNCFYYCKSLEKVYFPAGIESLGSGMFEGCSNLREFTGDADFLFDSHSIVKNGSMLAFAGRGVENYSIPEGVQGIINGVFNGWQDLRSLTFPSSLDNLWSGWLGNCENLAFFYGPGVTEDNHLFVLYGEYLVGATAICPPDYEIPKDAGIKRIFCNVFEGNKSIEKLTIPDDVYYIGPYSLQDMSNLKTLVLPASLTNFSSNMFSGDTSLETVYMRAFTPPTYRETYEDAFIGHDGFVIYVPEGSEDLYKSAEGWSLYADYIQGYKFSDVETPDYYISTDFSHNGEVHTLQTATQGAGINLVLMGDAFSDRQIADGTYKKVMDMMMEAFFDEEPYTTLRPMFNVSFVTVVSTTEGYDHGGQALSGYFSEGTLVGGNDNKCMELARAIVGDENMDNTLIIVAMNSSAYAGTCWMYYPNYGDYGVGTAVAYFPIGEQFDDLARLVHHEAGGHGFSKLADEYAYEYKGVIPQSEIDNRNVTVPFGWWKNCDFTEDHNLVKWSHFLADERYSNEGLGCFEGAFTYWKGAWRPTENSIMRHNTGGFNAPSREAIWYRAHKLAYGDSWQYDLEKFVSYDAKNRKNAISAPAQNHYVERPLPPLHAPQVIPMTWCEALKQAMPDTQPRIKSGRNKTSVTVPESDTPVSTRDTYLKR